MADQAKIETEKNLPHGNVEGVPTRQAGKEDKGLLSPTQDEGTDKRRQKYGETDRNVGSPAKQFEVPELRVNQIPTPNNPTRDERIRGSNSDKNPETGYARASVQ